MAAAPPSTPPYPLYNTTFTLHRLSPLHTTALTPSTLHTHASHLHDLLTGSILRGVRVGLPTDAPSALSRIGSLRSVLFTPLGTSSEWAAADPNNNTAPTRGILLEIVYDKATYTAILLRDSTDRQEAPGFTHYPLLLTRMPAPLRTTLLEFLSSTFDARASALHVPSAVVVRALEGFLGDIGEGWRDVVRDVVVTMAFAGVEEVGVDVVVGREDVGGMVGRGGKGEGGFMKALGRYVKAHLGLEMGREEVRVVKVACGAWVLGGEGKVKVFEPRGEEGGVEVWRGACEKLVEGLVGWAGRREG